MAETEKNQELQDLLVYLTRSMLQYVGECWPWTGNHPEERQVIDELVARQRSEIAKLVDLLDARRQPIDFGSYPTEFTDLHYLALDHLLGELIEAEQALVETIEQISRDCAGDAEAETVVKEILAAERENLERLRELAAAHASRAAA